MNAATGSQSELRVEWRVNTRDGSLRWLAGRGAPERDAQGRALRYVGVVIDITQARQTEEALHDSDQRFRLALRNAPVSVAVQDRDLRYVWAYNQRTATEDEIIGKLDADVFTPEEADRLTAIKRRVLAEGAEFHEQMWLERPTGPMFLAVNFEPIRDEAGRAIGVGSATVDLTPMKVAEEALRESQAKLEAALASMTDAVFISDTQGNFVDFNEAFAVFHRFGSKSECARTLAEYPDILDVLTDDGEPAALDQWAVPRALRGEVATDAEYTLRRKDTGETWAGSYSFGPIRDEGGEIVGSVVVARDVTDRKHAEEERRLLNADLEDRVRQRTALLAAANQELEAFSYSVSHDLRAPLRHISGFANLLSERLGEGLDDESRHYLDVVTGSVAEMGVLIDDLLQFSRLGRAEMVVEDVDMMDLVRQVLAPLQAETAERDVAVRVGELPPARGDAVLLRQVWANLLGNAFKYTRTRDRALIEVDAEADGPATDYHVRDNGVGFDMEFAGKLFVVFQRLHDSAEFEGTGIGLANVRRIVARHGGHVWAEGQVDGGATFSFSLPRGQSG
jgi:PAS domain S-box-containing protein